MTNEDERLAGEATTGDDDHREGEASPQDGAGAERADGDGGAGPEAPAAASAAAPLPPRAPSGLALALAAIDRKQAAIGAALILVPGLVVAWLLGRPMTIATDLGFPTMIPGKSGVALHPSTFWFYVGILCVLAVGAGAAVLASALLPARRPQLGLVEYGPAAWLRRHGWALALFTITCLVLFPTLGHAGLWDPWESHYGLVGLRMVEQDDWISTLDMGWNEWFFSKPILLFWLMGFGLVGLGQNAGADGDPRLIEWAFRIPIALLALAAVMAVYLLASRRWGKRAGFLSGLVLLTMPQFFLIARQAMTDMPFVAPLTVGLCLLGLALGEKEDRPATAMPLFRGRLVLSSHHLLLVAITLVALPQALVVLTHNKAQALAVYEANAPAYEAARVEHHPTITDDVIVWGSLGQAEDGHDHCVDGDCSQQPGDPDRAQVNDKLRPETKLAYPVPWRGWTHRVWGLGFLLLWAVALVVVSRRAASRTAGPTQRDVYLYGFYLAMGVATLAKGPVGPAIAALVILAYLAVSGEWRELLRLRILRGLAVFLAAAGPWYAMMVVRHGNQWFQQFIIHDNFKRAGTGVHGDRGWLGYFVQQLGIGTFPWVALIPAALVALLWLRWEREDPRRPSEGERVALFAALWGVVMFAFFTVIRTKFHHYIFPALPALALCVGLLLDRMIGTRRRWVPLVAVGSLAMFAFVARDLTTTVGTRVRGYERLIQLYMYKYDRIWPDPKTYGQELDYSGEMLFFAALFGGLLALLLLPAARPETVARWRLPPLVSGIVAAPRKLVVTLLCAGGILWAGFGLHVYFNQISPHWSEGYLVKLYYDLRRGPEERLIAYSLNWHGENCYTANRAKILMGEHGFERDLDDFPEWLKRHEGRDYYFILSKGGSNGLKSKLDSAIPNSGKTVEVVSGDISNKYELARARLCDPATCPPPRSPAKPGLPPPAAARPRTTTPEENYSP
ncbi:MAG: glycosyltransferase family 39 protein [Deltaproteobacteria bacterium]|nr:glycosyltransferase family 39 protein [Deltaproteobacteria bacterium]